MNVASNSHRKMAKKDSPTKAIKELGHQITEMSVNMNSRMDEISSKVDSNSVKLDDLTSRVEALEEGSRASSSSSHYSSYRPNSADPYQTGGARGSPQGGN
eukprot:TCALIF_07129-PA protein Name:"Protein of unknown function" AED:0.18 eAED:0.19 QI:0/0/0.5/1/0/0/2/160/100